MKSFFKKVLNIGVSGFGGPAILGYIKKEFVEKENKLTEKEFYDGLSLSQMLPGATGANLITFIAYKHYGLIAALLSFFIFVSPSIITMSLFSIIYFKFGNINFIKTIFENINLAVVVIFITTLEKIVLPLAKEKLFLFVMIVILIGKLFFNINIFILVLFSIIVMLIFYNENKKEVLLEKYNLVFYPVPFIPFIVFIISFLLAYLFKKFNLINIYFEFSKTGFMVFGGGTASIPLIHDVLVNNLKWLSDKEFLTAISLAQLTPGPVLNIAAFAGYKLESFLGIIFASAGIFFPGFLLTLILTKYSEYILSISFFKKFTKGILVGFSTLFVYVFYNFFTQTIISIKNFILFLILLFLQYKFKLHPIIIIIITVLIGLILNFF